MNKTRKRNDPCPCAACEREAVCDWGCDAFCEWGKDLSEVEIADALIAAVYRPTAAKKIG